MKKLLGVSLLSALILVSCQKKEEVQNPTTSEQTTTTTQTTTQTQPQAQQPSEQKPSETAQQPVEEKPKEEAKKEQKQDQTKIASIDGKAIFTSKGCTACHQEAVDSVGPSLKKIASTYAGDKNKLLAFFKGEGKPIVDLAKEAIMKPQIEITKKLSKEEQEALADFILKH